ncbi:MAG: mechanosensitive ion channel [Chloroflexota bacterium]|nr:mechanosensitive ion channel [Anaerolineales bacterium]
MALLTQLQSLIMVYGLKALGAVIILVVGRWLAGFLSRTTRQALTKTKTDEALVRFGASLIYYGILIFAVLAALRQLGVETTSFVALVGAAGLAIGLALEGALSNFAAGVLLLIFRPFRIGDHVEIADKFGVVEEILIFSTILVTLDNKTITIPNSQVTGAPIVNYSKRGLIRLEMIFGIGYGDDLLKAKQLLMEIVKAEPRIAQDPAPVVAVKELADSSVNFTVRPFVKPADYWSVSFAITEQVKLRFDAEGISIPFPQRDVHLFSQN